MTTFDAEALPYTPRPLTRKELSKLDIYSYHSPKCNRLVRLVEPLRFGLGLLLEFDPTVLIYAERPRLLSSPQGLYEIDFWWLDKGGQESMAILVEHAKADIDAAGRRPHRQADALLVAAEKACLPLQFVLEADLVAKQHAMRTALRLLPSVQIATQLANLDELRREILDLFQHFDCMRVEHVVTSVRSECNADVRCAIAYLIHRGELVLVDPGTVCNMSRLRRGEA